MANEKKPVQQQETRNKECKKARRSKSKIAFYWNFRYPRNMFRRAQRVYNLILKRESNPLKAREHAERVAKAHGPQVEGALSRWLRGEKAFQ